MYSRLLSDSAVVFLVLLVACSSQNEQESSHSFRVFDEDGITVAETLGGPRYEGEIFEYIPLMTLDPGNTEENMLFNPTTVIVDSDGWLYINDRGNGDIVVFDPEGRFHKRFGRQGEGPGEFRYPRFICTMGDTLYVYDSSQRRTTRFRRSGEVVDMTSVQRNMLSPGMSAGMSTLIPLPGEDRLLLSSEDDSPSIPGGSADEGNSWCSVRRLTAAGDTVWSWSSDPIKTSYPVAVSIGDQSITISAPYPFAPRSQAFFVPDVGVVVMASYTPQLDILDLDGRHRRIRIEMGDLSVTEEDRQTVYDAYDKVMEEAPEEQTREIMEDQLKGLQFGETKAPWSSFKFDDQGYLYLTLMNPTEVMAYSTVSVGYMVVSPEGEYLGITRPPVGSAAISGGRILVNDSDSETGEFTLTVYDIRPVVRGLKYPK